MIKATHVSSFDPCKFRSAAPMFTLATLVTTDFVESGQTFTVPMKYCVVYDNELRRLLNAQPTYSVFVGCRDLGDVVAKWVTRRTRDRRRKNQRKRFLRGARGKFS